jgi:hypothetical protein
VSAGQGNRIFKLAQPVCHQAGAMSRGSGIAISFELTASAYDKRRFTKTREIADIVALRKTVGSGLSDHALYFGEPREAIFLIQNVEECPHDRSPIRETRTILRRCLFLADFTDIGKMFHRTGICFVLVGGSSSWYRPIERSLRLRNGESSTAPSKGPSPPAAQSRGSASRPTSISSHRARGASQTSPSASRVSSRNGGELGVPTKLTNNAI